MPMATRTRSHDRPAPPTPTRLRRAASWSCLGAGLALTVAWLGWRVTHLGLDPVAVTSLLIELSGLTAGTVVAIGLLRAATPRSVLAEQRRNPHRYALSVANGVGRTRSSDLQRDLRAAIDRLAERRVVGSAERAMVGVLIDGPRRVALVGMLVIALLSGVAPMSMPPAWALACITAGSIAISASHVLAAPGRIGFGDRTRWSFAALGELFAPADHASMAPRRWIGTVGTVVVLSLAIALRGMSDRWTHGLPAMSDDERIVTLVWASLVVIGGLFTLRTIESPNLANAHLVSRRLEERGARRSALGAAVGVGVIGLVAGILPAGVDAGDVDPGRPEAVTERETGGVIGDG